MYEVKQLKDAVSIHDGPLGSMAAYTVYERLCYELADGSRSGGELEMEMAKARSQAARDEVSTWDDDLVAFYRQNEGLCAATAAEHDELKLGNWVQEHPDGRISGYMADVAKVAWAEVNLESIDAQMQAICRRATLDHLLRCGVEQIGEEQGSGIERVAGVRSLLAELSPGQPLGDLLEGRSAALPGATAPPAATVRGDGALQRPERADQVARGREKTRG